jgi:uncharacterized protein (DUF885 family)
MNRLLALPFVALLCACHAATQPPPPASAGVVPAAGPARALSALAAAYWDARLETDPLEATEIGDRRFDDRLPDLSLEARARRADLLRAQRAQAEAIPAAALSPVDQTTRALLLGEIDSELAHLACALDDWAVDARDGLQVAFLRLPELQPVRTVAEGRKLVARWRAMGQTIDQETANLRRGLAAGKVTTRDEVTRVLGQLDDLLGKPDAAWPLHTPAAAPHPDWPRADAEALARDVEAAIAGSARPAFARQRDFLRGEVLPRARDDAHVGIGNIAGGGACYAHLIKVHTSLELSAEEIHRIGLEELARIQANMARVGREALGVGTLPEMRRRLESDRSLFFKSRDEIEAAARAALARAVAAEPRFLGRLPRTPVVVKRIEPYEEKDAPIAYYRPAAVDGTRPGTFYVNTNDPGALGRYQLEALVFHESVPGHHVQIATAQELTGLPEFRKHVGVTAFVEGWGLYAEGLADELGLYSGALERLGRLNFDAWRALRLIVDTGMHAFGWSRSRAIAYMEENAILAHGNVVNEVDRYIAWPGQALAYKVGEREIRRLRADAEARLGQRFDLRAFHDALLGSGAVSLPVLREQIDTWTKLAAP